MSIHQRAVLTAIGLLLAVTAIAADKPTKPTPAPPRPDPLLNGVPARVRAACEAAFPNHRCLRLVARPANAPTSYRLTFMHPDSRGVHTRTFDGERISTPIMYEIELEDDGTVIEETRRYIDPARLPKPVADAYKAWNPTGFKGMFVEMTTEVPRGKPRIYYATILVNAIKSYSATFKPDGTVLSAAPMRVP